jgi:hypothetical protein
VCVIVQQSQLTTATISQRKDPCIILLNCCIVQCDDWHVQSSPILDIGSVYYICMNVFMYVCMDVIICVFLVLCLSLSHICIYIYIYMHTYIYTIRTRLLNIGSFVGVFVKHTQLTTTPIRQREDACMNLLNCCISN